MSYYMILFSILIILGLIIMYQDFKDKEVSVILISFHLLFLGTFLFITGNINGIISIIISSLFVTIIFKQNKTNIIDIIYACVTLNLVILLKTIGVSYLVLLLPTFLMFLTYLIIEKKKLEQIPYLTLIIPIISFYCYFLR